MKRLFPAVMLVIGTTVHAFPNSPISTSAGIAAPAGATALSENPTGLLYKLGWGAGVFAHSSGSETSDASYGALLGAGNRSYGMGIGIERQNSSTLTQTNALYGLALHLSSLNLGIGISGQSGLSPTKGSTYNIGAIVGPFSRFRLGFLATGVDSKKPHLGAGFAFPLSPELLFATDFGMDYAKSNIGAQPGILLKGGGTSIGINYGTKIKGNAKAAPFIHEGISAGVGFKLASRTELSAHYEHLDKVYVQFSFGL